MKQQLAAAAATAAASGSACEPSRSLARSEPTHLMPPARCKARARQRSLTYCSRAAYNHGLHTVRHPATIQAWPLALSLDAGARRRCVPPTMWAAEAQCRLHPMQNSLALPSCQAFGYLFVTVTSCVTAVAMEAQDEVPCKTTSGKSRAPMSTARFIMQRRRAQEPMAQEPVDRLSCRCICESYGDA